MLIDHGVLVVPEVSFEISASTNSGAILYESDVLSPQRRICFDRTAAEVTIDNIRPDIVGYRGERQLLVEMYFRHRVDPDKRDKLKKLGFAALEIDLSDLDPLDGFEAVKERVIDGVIYKEWLVYPRSDEHLAYLKHKLRARVESANEAHRAEVECRSQERAKLAKLEKAKLVTLVDVDTAFACWAPDEQEAWLRQQLGLTASIPAFLSRQSYPGTLLKVPAFLFQASIFERFVYGSKGGTRLTAEAIYPCLRRRFDLSPQDRDTHRAVINLYLEYLTRARFLHRAADRELCGPYCVEHSDISMPPWTPAETQYDGQPLLSAQARGLGPHRRWSSTWPRWRAVLDEAREVLAGSPHRDHLLDALNELSTRTPPPSPHHWAAPLVERGIPLDDCFELLSGIGLMAS
jgi:hypothetical protein